MRVQFLGKPVGVVITAYVGGREDTKKKKA